MATQPTGLYRQAENPTLKKPVNPDTLFLAPKLPQPFSVPPPIQACQIYVALSMPPSFNH